MERLQNTPYPPETAQIEGFVVDEPYTPTEVVVFQYEPPASRMKPNQIRHAENMAVFTGFWHGSYYRRGVLQRKK